MKKILVVDDEFQVREMISSMLKRYGYETVTASNGFDAWEKIEKDVFDLIITDLIMPEKQGMELIIELRKINPSIKIIAITGGGLLGVSDEYLEVAEHFGANKVLSKPFDYSNLIDAVKELLNDS